MIARSRTLPEIATPATEIATRSQARNLLSIARLNSVRSRTALVIWRRVRMAQTSFGFNGSFLTDNAPRVPATHSLAPKATPHTAALNLQADGSYFEKRFFGWQAVARSDQHEGTRCGTKPPFSVTCFISDLRGSWGDRKDQRFCQGVELWEPMTAEGRERALNQVFSRPGRTTWSAMSMPGCSRNRQANCHCQAALKAPGQVQLYRLHSQECRCV